MALRTKMKLLSLSGLLMAAMCVISLFATVQLVHAAGESQPPNSNGMMWQVIILLSGALSTVWTGIGVWLIANQREIFQRVGRLETGEEVRKELCDERHPRKP
jgi:hypothetical protein